MTRAGIVKIVMVVAVIIVLLIGWKMLKGSPVVAGAPAAA